MNPERNASDTTASKMAKENVQRHRTAHTIAQSLAKSKKVVRVVRVERMERKNDASSLTAKTKHQAYAAAVVSSLSF